MGLQKIWYSFIHKCSYKCVLYKVQFIDYAALLCKEYSDLTVTDVNPDSWENNSKAIPEKES